MKGMSRYNVKKEESRRNNRGVSIERTGILDNEYYPISIPGKDEPVNIKGITLKGWKNDLDRVMEAGKGVFSVFNKKIELKDGKWKVDGVEANFKKVVDESNLGTYYKQLYELAKQFDKTTKKGGEGDDIKLPENLWGGTVTETGGVNMLKKQFPKLKDKFREGNMLSNYVVNFNGENYDLQTPDDEAKLLEAIQEYIALQP